MLWCLSGFSRLTAHETALLIFAALMVVSFTLLLFYSTLKNKFSQHSTFILCKQSPTLGANTMHICIVYNHNICTGL